MSRVCNLNSDNPGIEPDPLKSELDQIWIREFFFRHHLCESDEGPYYEFDVILSSVYQTKHFIYGVGSTAWAQAMNYAITNYSGVCHLLKDCATSIHLLWLHASSEKKYK